LAIRACSKIIEENPKLNISIIFIGDKKGNEKYVSNLEKLSNALELSNYIKILGNFNNMALAYHVSDIILYPSIIPEPFGRVPIEAQAAGKIIIASNNGGMTETIKEGEDNTGFRIRNNDMEDLKNKINIALNLNNDEINNLRKRAIEHVDKNFSLENMCKKTLDVYDRILNVSKK
jgi:Glycosyltransferase